MSETEIESTRKRVEVLAFYRGCNRAVEAASAAAETAKAALQAQNRTEFAAARKQLTEILDQAERSCKDAPRELAALSRSFRRIVQLFRLESSRSFDAIAALYNLSFGFGDAAGDLYAKLGGDRRELGEVESC